MKDSEQRLRASINEIADQLCQAVDGEYGFHVSASSNDPDIQKLCVLSNFVLESVRRNLSELNNIRAGLQQRVDERTRRLDLIIQGANDGVWEWDLVADRVTVSERWRSMSGCQDWPAEFMPLRWMERIHARDRGRFTEALLQHANGLTNRFSAEYRLSDGRGGYRWMVARGICDFDPETGDPRMMAGTQADITQQKFIDSASGLPNTQYLELILDQRLETVVRADGRNLAGDTALPVLMLVYLPNLPLVRESLRDREGVQLARAVRQRLEACLSPGEMAARLADGTPALLLQDRGDADVQSRARGVMAQFDRPVALDNRNVWLSVSVGVVEPQTHGMSSSEQVLQAARTLIRRLRTGSSGQLLVYEQTMQYDHRQRLNNEQLLRDALIEGWVEPFLQPLVDLFRGEVTGFEVLCRIRHPEQGLISPALFIPVAEETGLIRQLGEQVLDHSLALLKDPSLRKAFGSDFTLSLNLSPVELREPHLARGILEKVAQQGVDPSRLKLELTETAVMADSGLAVDTMNRLRDAGLAVALDDFGAGYSSLALVRTLPLDQLKIDRSLVSGIDRDEEQRAILEMILTLCDRLGLTVVVEGVETERELSCLAGMGAHIAQGFLFSKPLPVSTLIRDVPRRGLLAAVASAGAQP